MTKFQNLNKKYDLKVYNESVKQIKETAHIHTQTETK